MATEPTSTQAPPKGSAERSTKMIKVDLHNPTRSTRGIDCGDEAHTRISILSGETKRNVSIAEWVARELKARTRGKNNVNADLHVYPAGQAPDLSKSEEEDLDDGDGE